MSTRVWKQGLLAIPGVGVSLLPKLICPLCWPGYAGLLSTLGLGFLISTTYLFPLTAALVALAVGSLAFRALRRRGLGPFWLGLAAAAFVLTGKFYFESVPATYAGVGLLVCASLWNAWPRRVHVALWRIALFRPSDRIRREIVPLLAKSLRRSHVDSTVSSPFRMCKSFTGTLSATNSK